MRALCDYRLETMTELVLFSTPIILLLALVGALALGL
jgi:hypothetical protein